MKTISIKEAIEQSLVRNPLTEGQYRNMKCPCGSGKKTKKCHGIKTAITKDEFKEIVEMGKAANKAWTEALKKQDKNKESSSQGPVA